MTRRRVLPAVALFALVAPVSCGGASAPGGAASSSPAVEVESSSAAPTSAPTVAPTPPSVDSAPRKYGQVFTFENDTMTTTVLRYKQPVGSGPDDMAKGEALGGIEVRTCVLASSPKSQLVSVLPWSLEWADGTTTDSHWSGVVASEYPYDRRTVKPGRCVKGWIVFTVQDGKRPALAVYEGQANEGQPAEWSLG